MIGKRVVGLDISDHTIEVVALGGSPTNPAIISMNRASLPPGIVEYGLIKDEKKLTEVLNKLFDDAKPEKILKSNIIFGLPESLTYIHVFHVGKEQSRDIATVVEHELTSFVPIEQSSLAYTYSILRETKEGSDIVAVAVDKQVIASWQSFFKKNKFEVETMDIESLALARNVPAVSTGSYAMVDIGDKTTRVSVFDSFGMRFNYTIQLAGDHISQAIADGLHIEREEAEEEKIETGMLGKNKKITDIIKVVSDDILSHINEGLAFYHKQSGQEVVLVVFVGGSSQLKGFVEYAGKTLKKETRLGTSRLNKKNISFEYLEAIGLALRGLSKKWDKRDPLIELDNLRQIKGVVEPKIKQKKTTEGHVDVDTLVQSPKKQKHIKQIIIVCVCVVLAFGGAFLYRNLQRNKTSSPPDLPKLKELDSILEIKDKADGITVSVSSTVDNISTSTE